MVKSHKASDISTNPQRSYSRNLNNNNSKTKSKQNATLQTISSRKRPPSKNNNQRMNAIIITNKSLKVMERAGPRSYKEPQRLLIIKQKSQQSSNKSLTSKTTNLVKDLRINPKVSHLSIHKATTICLYHNKQIITRTTTLVVQT